MKEYCYNQRRGDWYSNPDKRDRLSLKVLLVLSILTRKAVHSTRHVRIQNNHVKIGTKLSKTQTVLSSVNVAIVHMIHASVNLFFLQLL